MRKTKKLVAFAIMLAMFATAFCIGGLHEPAHAAKKAVKAKGGEITRVVVVPTKYTCDGKTKKPKVTVYSGTTKLNKKYYTLSGNLSAKRAYDSDRPYGITATGKNGYYGKATGYWHIYVGNPTNIKAKYSKGKLTVTAKAPYCKKMLFYIDGSNKQYGVKTKSFKKGSKYTATANVFLGKGTHTVTVLVDCNNDWGATAVKDKTFVVR